MPAIVHTTYGLWLADFWLYLHVVLMDLLGLTAMNSCIILHYSQRITIIFGYFRNIYHEHGDFAASHVSQRRGQRHYYQQLITECPVCCTVMSWVDSLKHDSFWLGDDSCLVFLLQPPIYIEICWEIIINLLHMSICSFWFLPKGATIFGWFADLDWFPTILLLHMNIRLFCFLQKGPCQNQVFLKIGPHPPNHPISININLL